jgi:uncharacterized membrane protein YhaH (DUF805 family)
MRFEKNSNVPERALPLANLLLGLIACVYIVSKIVLIAKRMQDINMRDLWLLILLIPIINIILGLYVLFCRGTKGKK